MKAIWNEKTIAESDDTVVVENNHYFPKDSVNFDYLKENKTETYTCPWKGEAKYYDVVVDGETSGAAAWEYPEPKKEAMMIKDRIAFWKGVEITE